MLSVELYTDDIHVVEICRAYWQQSGRRAKHRTSNRPKPVYAFTVREVAQRFGLTDGELRATVRQNCNAFEPDWKCTHCGKPFVFWLRNQVEEREHISDDSPCAMCCYEEIAERDSMNWPAVADLLANPLTKKALEAVLEARRATDCS